MFPFLETFVNVIGVCICVPVECECLIVCWLLCSHTLNYFSILLCFSIYNDFPLPLVVFPKYFLRQRSFPVQFERASCTVSHFYSKGLAVWYRRDPFRCTKVQVALLFFLRDVPMLAADAVGFKLLLYLLFPMLLFLAEH